ncbi:MAG: LysM peptidoglycan-binding domain-containing protein [Oscillospiraceae bacterium]|nr:LysM peptidoglycan-binding domain-containing protein [Oscillospiraceae bacterium]
MQKSKILSFIVASLVTVSLLITNVCALKPDSDKLMNGIDVSRYQQNVDYTSVYKSGIKTVYIRAAYGLSKDVYFERNYKNARDAGLNYGFYLFVTARNAIEARIQAIFFATLIENTGYNCRPVMDFEDFNGYTKSQVNTVGLAFLQQLEASTGVKPIIYTNSYSANTIWNKDVGNYYLWAAHYGVQEPRITSGIWNSWIGFQYSSTGRVPGISGHVDLDKFTDTVLINSPQPTPPAPDIPDKSKTENLYTVKYGDSLYSIAQQFNTTVSSLVQINSIRNPDLIYPGQVLKLKASSSQPVNPPASQYTVYTVKSGDTLWDIANKFNVTISSITSANNIRNANLIYPGQKLTINSTENAATERLVITVKRGDTLSGIADRYNTTVSSLVKANNISDPDLIYTGQTLIIV